MKGELLEINKISEDQLREIIINELRKKGIKDICTEVDGCFGKCYIDLVYRDEQGRFVCVEVKLRDWRRVIQQAEVIKYWVTGLVYIAMPKPKNRNVKKKVECICRIRDIGLLWITDYGMLGGNTIKKIQKASFELGAARLATSFYENLLFMFLSRVIDYKNKRR